MPDWSIKITSQFEPSKANVKNGDLVSWDNEANVAHWPWPVTSATAPPQDPLPPSLSPLSPNPIKPHSSSDDYSVTANVGTTIFYCCKLHPNERGSLVVVPFGGPSEDTPSV